MKKVFLPRLKKYVEMYDYIEGIDIINNMLENSAECVKAYSKKTKHYSTAFMAFDIETTKVKNENSDAVIGKDAFFNFPYCWQAYTSDEHFIFGRDINEYFKMIDSIETKGKYLITFVHNLAFEYNNLADKFIDRIEDIEKDIFFKNLNKPLFFRLHKYLEYRCTYLLTRKSLAKLSKEVGLKKNKDFDYTIQRDCETPLKNYEYEYCYGDVYNLVTWLKKEIRNYNKSISENPKEYFNVAKLPLTQTGYVRADIKRVFSNTPVGKTILRETKLDEKEYLIVKDSFIGAFTHANPQKIGKILYNVGHIDLKSAYPAVMALRNYPKGKPHRIYEGDINTVYNLVNKGKHVIATYLLSDIKLKENNCFGYLPFAHCKAIENKDLITENGKIISAKKLAITLNEIDLYVASQVYDFGILGVTNILYFNSARLPVSILDVLFKYFDNKTSLKNIDYEEYMLSKNKLNAMYGMGATDLMKPIIKLSGYECEKNGINYSNASVIPYQWATYITAYVRQVIVTTALKMGNDYVYADTDSLFFTNPNKYEQIVKNHNDKCINDIVNLRNEIGEHIHYEMTPKTDKGVTQYLLTFDYEPTCKAFMTIGAKRYIIMLDNRKIEMTFSGLSDTKIRENGDEGWTVNYIRNHYGNPFYAIYNVYKGKELFIPYCEGHGKLSNYVQRGEYIGHINNKEVSAKASMVLYEQDTTITMTPDIIDYIAYLKEGIELE